MNVLKDNKSHPVKDVPQSRKIIFAVNSICGCMFLCQTTRLLIPLMGNKECLAVYPTNVSLINIRSPCIYKDPSYTYRNQENVVYSTFSGEGNILMPLTFNM